MKTIISAIALIIISSGSLFSQSSSTERKPERNISEFSATYIFPKVYLKWNVTGQETDGLFVIEVEKNGKFEPVGSKECIGVPVTSPIMYCFNYIDSTYSGSNFRVRCFSDDPKVLISKPVSAVEKDNGDKIGMVPFRGKDVVSYRNILIEAE